MYPPTPKTTPIGTPAQYKGSRRFGHWLMVMVGINWCVECSCSADRGVPRADIHCQLDSPIATTAPPVSVLSQAVTHPTPTDKRSNSCMQAFIKTGIALCSIEGDSIYNSTIPEHEEWEANCSPSVFSGKPPGLLKCFEVNTSSPTRSRKNGEQLVDVEHPAH